MVKLCGSSDLLSPLRFFAGRSVTVDCGVYLQDSSISANLDRSGWTPRLGCVNKGRARYLVGSVTKKTVFDYSGY